MSCASSISATCRRRRRALDGALCHQGDASPQGHLDGICRRRALLDPPAPRTSSSGAAQRGGRKMSHRSYLLDVAGARRKIRVFEVGDGAPLVFLHGTGGLTEDSPFLAALARRWRVFAPLLPGYGDSKAPRTCATCSQGR